MAEDLFLNDQFNRLPAHGMQIVPTGQPASVTKLLGDIAAAAPVPALGPNGLPQGPGTQVRLSIGRNSDGSVLAATAASGKFGVASTLGTSWQLVTQAASSSTITDTIDFEMVLPTSYISPQPVTLTSHANLIIGSGTVTGTATTLSGSLYVDGGDGTQGSNLLSSGNSGTLGTADAVFNFVTQAQTGLAPGKRVWVRLVAKIVETSGNAVTAVINSVQLH